MYIRKQRIGKSVYHQLMDNKQVIGNFKLEELKEMILTKKQDKKLLKTQRITINKMVVKYVYYLLGEQL